MKERLIITRADDNVKEMTKMTHPILKRYAKKVNADFLVITDNVPAPMHHFRILQCYDLLKKYNRIMHLDGDILIHKNCPDLFDIVPYNKIGTLLEDIGSREVHRRILIKDIQDERGYVDWYTGYINTGVFVVSDIHKNIFNISNENLWSKFGQDDVELGYQIHKNKFEIFELPFKYNHMSMFSEDWNGNASRFESLILHYAGNAFYSFMTNTEEIKQDLALLRKFKSI